MPRFFIPPKNTDGKTVKITGEDARHIARSLRMAVGDALTVTDGEGTDYDCRLTYIRDEECECDIVGSFPSLSEPKGKITLYMAYPKGDKMETVIQKSVELGVYRIVPFESSRCIKRPDKSKSDKLKERHNRIAKEAAKQSGRGRLVEVAEIKSFAEVLEELGDYSLSLFCYEGEENESLKDALQKHASFKNIAVIIGSEGGFSPEEAEKITSAGAVSVSLGKRILRCETAPSFVLSALSFYYEL